MQWNETQILDFVEVCVFVTCSHCTKHRADLAHPTVHGHGSFGAIVIYLHAKKRSQVWTCPVKSEMLGLRTLGSINCIFSPIPSRNPWFTYGQAYWILSIASNYSLSWESLIDEYPCGSIGFCSLLGFRHPITSLHISKPSKVGAARHSFIVGAGAVQSYHGSFLLLHWPWQHLTTISPS